MHYIKIFIEEDKKGCVRNTIGCWKVLHLAKKGLQNKFWCLIRFRKRIRSSIFQQYFILIFAYETRPFKKFGRDKREDPMEWIKKNILWSFNAEKLSFRTLKPQNIIDVIIFGIVLWTRYYLQYYLLLIIVYLTLYLIFFQMQNTFWSFM